MSVFSLRLKELRNKSDKSLRQVGSDLSISFGTFAGYENGRGAPDLEMVDKLAKYFNVSTDYLLGRTDDPRPFPVEDTRSIDEKIKDEGFAYALYDGARDLSDAEKEELLDLFELIKMKRERDKKNKGN